MSPTQQTLRMRGLPSKTKQTDVEYHLNAHIKDRGRQSVVGIGPICKEPGAETTQTTVTFSSTETAKLALELDQNARRLIAEQGGAEKFSLDDEFRGMTTLQCLLNPKTGQPDIDIVAVHGLTGHAWKTFTTIEDGGPSYSAKRENNWLQENLPRLLKQHREQNIYARVMSYGYNADVWMTDSAAELDVPVDTLLWALQNERQEDPDRPLFLIGHSLGGIVIKEAVKKIADEVLAQAIDPDESSQKKYLFPIKGCLFFGVPHKGAKAATLASGFLSALSKFSSVHTNHVRDLQPKSERLARVSHEFEATRSNLDLPVLSFFETKTLSHFTGLVVSPDSAILDYPGKPRPFGIDKDHREMVKFLNDNEEGLKAATLFLTELAKQATRQQSARHNLESKNLVWKLTGAGQAHSEDRLSILRDYDTVFLIDDSPSMAGKNWDLVKDILDVCTPVAAHYDRDGIDIHFINNTDHNQPHVKDPQIAVQIHHQIRCMGRSLLVDRIDTHLRKYLQGFKNAGYAADHKRYNLIVITDGEPDDADDGGGPYQSGIKPAFGLLQKRLARHAKKLDSDDVDAAQRQVGIQFCQIGKDQAATEFFAFLDDRLRSKEDLDRDMIDTIRCEEEVDLTEEFYRKLLTGAIDPEWDRQILQKPEAAEPLLSRAASMISTATTHLPNRSNTTRTGVSRSSSQHESTAGPSRMSSFPVEPTLEPLAEVLTGEDAQHRPYTAPPIRRDTNEPAGWGNGTTTTLPRRRSNIVPSFLRRDGP